MFIFLHVPKISSPDPFLFHDVSRCRHLSSGFFEGLLSSLPQGTCLAWFSCGPIDHPFFFVFLAVHEREFSAFYGGMRPNLLCIVGSFAVIHRQDKVFPTNRKQGRVVFLASFCLLGGRGTFLKQ